MLINDGVNLACDWWGLGVLMFELLTGDLPFSDSGGDEMRTYQNILHANLDWNYDPILRKPDVRAIIEGFLTVKVAYRLGCLIGGVQEVISHCWFSTMKWENLVNKTIRPPWQPTLGNCDDGTFFDEFKSESFVIDSSEDREGDTLDVNSKLQDAWAELSAVFGEPSTLSSSQSTGAAAPSSTESV
ncbi:MAG: hypothetical protein SGPRY_014300 [Prymnesium sp.]